MKKFILILFIMFAVIKHNAQITQETTYQNAGISNALNNFAGYLSLVHLSSQGYKYCIKTPTTITLYNLNHSLYQTINTPATPSLVCSNCALNVWFLSDALFDTNPSNIEYLWLYTTAGNNISHIRIFDQNGNALLAEDSIVAPGSASYGQEEFIAKTTSGVKMIIYKTSGVAKVFSLPGVLPCHDCTNGIISGLAANGHGNVSSGLDMHPNPASEQTIIEYQLPKGSTGEIIIYDEKGTEIKTYKVTSDFNNLTLSVADLSPGIYYYQMRSSGSAPASKKMVVIH